MKKLLMFVFSLFCGVSIACNAPQNGIVSIVTVTPAVNSIAPQATENTSEYATPVVEESNPTETAVPTQTPKPACVKQPLPANNSACVWDQITLHLCGTTEYYVVGSGKIKGPSITNDWDKDGKFYGDQIFTKQGKKYTGWVGGILYEGESLEWDQSIRATINTFSSNDDVDKASKYWLTYCAGGDTQVLIQDAPPIYPTATPAR